jgi:hypothetical protein
MNPNNLLASITMLITSISLPAQDVNYSNLEKRFVKKELTSDDTLAFRKVGEQKVEQLFDKSQFYSQNYSNTSNQVYVKQQIPDLFYVPPGDSLDVTGLVRAIEQAESKQNGTVKLQTKPRSGYLGMVETLNYDPKFTFYLVLMQIPKSFGKEQELVWQVFLHKPEIHEAKAKKMSKKSWAE